jgi:hypothetical protein
MQHFHHGKVFQRLQRALLLSLVFMCSALPLSAQWSVGVQAGTNLSFLSDIPINHLGQFMCSREFFPKFMIGMTLEKEISDYWSVQSGLYFTQRCADCGAGEVFTATNIAVPILAKRRWERSVFSPYLLGGLLIGYHSNARYGRFQDEVPMLPFDLGLVGGLGASYPMSQHISLFLDARYVLGLTNLKESRAYPAFAQDIRIGAGVVYRFE